MSRVTTNCPTCQSEGERGSCARLRCYCGHSGCYAFDSYFKPEPAAVATVRAPDKRMAQSWAEREEPTWLDR
jgi:hypothetical protein